MTFLRFGFAAAQIRSQFRVLGVDVLASSEKLGCTHNARLEQGHAAAIRLVRAPVDVKVKEFLWRTRILPKITWGWWLSEVPKAIQNKVFADFRKVAAVHKMASKHLRMMLNGHALSFPFMILQQSISALRAAGLAGLQWAAGTGMWIQSVQSTLHLWGWTIVAPWQWHHFYEGTIWLLQDDKAESEHKLRESWRRFCWDNFCAQERRGRRQLPGVRQLNDYLVLPQSMEGRFSAGLPIHCRVIRKFMNELPRLDVACVVIAPFFLTGTTWPGNVQVSRPADPLNLLTLSNSG